MNNYRDYLEDAVVNDYCRYTPKGLKLRADPFLNVKLADSSKKLLVVGVALGGGEEIEALNKYFPNHHIYGIDVAKSALNQKVNAKLIYSDIADLKFKDNFFSGIMCSAVMHEVYSYSSDGKKKVGKAISEISRVLVKDGICAIREFFVPENMPCKLICLTKESKEFAKKFIPNFRANFNNNFKREYIIKKDGIYSSRRFLTELMLHFRVVDSHFNSIQDFLNSKEIEEEYLPMSLIDYSELIWENGMDIISVKYINFPKYHAVINRHFRLFDMNNKEVKNKYGFIDIVFRKK